MGGWCVWGGVKGIDRRMDGLRCVRVSLPPRHAKQASI